MSTLQNGDCAIGKCGRASFRLDIYDQSQGLVSSCSDSPWMIQISAVGTVANESISLPGSTIRPEYSASDIHRIVESIASHLRQNFCLNVHVYLDDWLF